MTRLCFVDCETTSLRPDRRAWEVGLIVREPWTVKHPDGPDTSEPMERQHHWFVDSADLDLGNADLISLKIGRYHDRHPDALFAANPHHCIPDVGRCKPEREVMREVEAKTRGAHLVGAVVSFDAEVLATRMRAHGICPSWHYHLIDVEALAVGALAAASAFGKSAAGSMEQEAHRIISPPWKSDDLSDMLGVKTSDEEKHTALGDAKWAMQLYDAVMGGPR